MGTMPNRQRMAPGTHRPVGRCGDAAPLEDLGRAGKMEQFDRVDVIARLAIQRIRSLSLADTAACEEQQYPDGARLRQPTTLLNVPERSQLPALGRTHGTAGFRPPSSIATHNVIVRAGPTPGSTISGRRLANGNGEAPSARGARRLDG